MHGRTDSVPAGFFPTPDDGESARTAEAILARSVTVEVRYSDENGRLHLRRGSGVAAGEGVWLTCAHLLPPTGAAGSCRIVFPSGNAVAAAVCGADREADRMLLQAAESGGIGESEGAGEGAEAKRRAPAASVGVSTAAPALVPGSRVWVAGQTADGRLCLSVGRLVFLSGIGPRGERSVGVWLALDVYAAPGYSGGGVFDADGRFLGIVCGKTVLPEAPCPALVWAAAVAP